MKINKIVVSMIAAGVMASPLAHATNGYLPTGYGAKNEAMGGASIALPMDALAAANNPAGMVMVGDHTDFGLILFRPNRSTEVKGNVCGLGCSLDSTYDGNGKSNFFIPSFGYNKMISADTSVGVSVFGNGGMNTQYNTNPLNSFGPPGTDFGKLGINLEQLFIAPTLSKKLSATNAVGVAVNLAYQRFSATGLQPFSAGSTAPSSLTNNGTDTATGYGFRIGWTGELNPQVTFGATYQSETKMGKFSKYSGLFAGQGNFDIPSNLGIGIAVKATPETTVAFDIQNTNYADVPAVNNSLVLPTNLGANNGAGFGWQNITTLKLGISHAYNSRFTVRAGVNHCDQPIPSSQTFFNVLAPGIVQNHLSLGGTWKLADKSEVSVAYVHAFMKTVNGSSSGYGSGSIPAPYGGGNANISMHEDAISVAYGW